MLFNSIEFLIFLPIVFLLYWLVLKGREARNFLLLIASYTFYAWWNLKFLILIIGISLCSYYSGYAIEYFKKSDNRVYPRLILTANIAINLGVLCLFKYFNFFAASFASVMSAIGWKVDAVTLDLILPVGISFYTFQALSYSIDVYRGEMKATQDLPAFLVFISFFPQLVAGPIERATNLLPQFLRKTVFSYPQAVSGMRLILWGLFKKMVVADNAAPIVDRIFGPELTQVGPLNLWIGAFLFTIQIYCDFSGYSDIAIGVGRLFGVTLMRNFRFPYLSRSITEFWQRWHISLTGWFRDYIYIPLGGNRKGKARTLSNTATVFLVSGLWHGANFTFIVWGLYHALLFIPARLMGNKNGKSAQKNRKIVTTTLWMGLTFLLVMIGWIIFRADTLSDVAVYLRLMFSPEPLHELLYHGVLGKTAVVWSIILLLLELTCRHGETPFDFNGGFPGRYRSIRWCIYLLFFFIILIFAGSSEQFIYFQF